MIRTLAAPGHCGDRAKRRPHTPLYAPLRGECSLPASTRQNLTEVWKAQWNLESALHWKS